jgi:hypothetical protein
MAGGALLGAGFNAIRQGIQILEGSRSEFSWSEVGTAATFGAAAAPLFVLAPEVMIPLTLGLGLMSAGNEYARGNWGTGTFDLVTSFIPLGFKGVRDSAFGRGSFWRPVPRGSTRLGLVKSTVGKRYANLVKTEIATRFALSEQYYRLRLAIHEELHGTTTVHSMADHGAGTTFLQQLHRIRTAVPPSGRTARPTRFGSRFLTYRHHFRAAAEAVRRQRMAIRSGQGDQPVRFSMPEIIGEGLERLGPMQPNAQFTHYVARNVVYRFDDTQRLKYYTGYPER